MTATRLWELTISISFSNNLYQARLNGVNHEVETFGLSGLTNYTGTGPWFPFPLPGLSPKK